MGVKKGAIYGDDLVNIPDMIAPQSHYPTLGSLYNEKAIKDEPSRYVNVFYHFLFILAIISSILLLKITIPSFNIIVTAISIILSLKGKLKNNN